MQKHLQIPNTLFELTTLIYLKFPIYVKIIELCPILFNARSLMLHIYYSYTVDTHFCCCAQ